MPELLEGRGLELDTPTAARTTLAAAEVGYAAEALDPEFEPLARLLLRSEGVASSYIEGVTAPVVDVVLAEERLGRARPGRRRGWRPTWRRSPRPSRAPRRYDAHDRNAV